MSSGPIEFLGESPTPGVPPTEMGGGDGLIQPARKDGLFAGAPEAKGGHILDGDAGGVKEVLSENRGIMARAAGRPLSLYEQRSGVSVAGEVVVDPHTGRVLPADASEDVTGNGGKPSDMKP